MRGRDPLVYACVHAVRQADDYKVLRQAKLGIVILASNGGAVRSATLADAGSPKPWCSTAAS